MTHNGELKEFSKSTDMGSSFFMNKVNTGFHGDLMHNTCKMFLCASVGLNPEKGCCQTTTQALCTPGLALGLAKEWTLLRPISKTNAANMHRNFWMPVYHEYLVFTLILRFQPEYVRRNVGQWVVRPRFPHNLRVLGHFWPFRGSCPWIWVILGCSRHGFGPHRP